MGKQHLDPLSLATGLFEGFCATSRASSKRNFEVVEAREDGQLVAAAAEPLGGPEFRTNGVLGAWHDL
jgi:hypothetical protein